MARTSRQARPALEGLEDRKLLNARSIGPNGKPINDKDLAHYLLQKQNGVPVDQRRIIYTTPQGTTVTLTLFGLGTLKGTTVDPQTGVLNILYNGTNSSSKIIAHTYGGTGRAPIASLRDADIPARSAISTGSNAVNVVNLSHLDLIDGGYINLNGGVNNLYLASAGRDTQIHLKPISSTTSTAADTGTTALTGAGSTGNVGVGTGGAPVVGGNTGGAVALGGSTTTVAAPTGAVVQIAHVNAGPLGTPPLQPPQIYGYDPTAGQLLRFDAVSGAVTQTIPIGSLGGTPIAGVGLGRNNGRLVVLVGAGTTIAAFDAVTGTPVGQFSTASLAANGLHTIAGLGSTDTRTVLTDPTAGPAGLAQIIDVTASLASGQAVPVGAPFAPQREFALSGGLAGLPGSNVLYATGSAHFDPFQPDKTQIGVLGFTSAGGRLSETQRTAIPGVGTPFVNADPAAPPAQALGSIDGDLALVSAVAGGRNIVVRYNPSTLVPDGVVGLASPNRLVGLSESFHPELLNAALLDVTGNLKTYSGATASGLVINDNGTLNLVAIQRATDTTVIGRPLSHVAIPVRRNVQLLSTARITPSSTALVTPPGTRGGVTIIPSLGTVGPLTLP